MIDENVCNLALNICKQNACFVVVVVVVNNSQYRLELGYEQQEPVLGHGAVTVSELKRGVGGSLGLLAVPALSAPSAAPLLLDQQERSTDPWQPAPLLPAWSGDLAAGCLRLCSKRRYFVLGHSM